jgi:hypothetical protein
MRLEGNGTDKRFIISTCAKAEKAVRYTKVKIKIIRMI